MTSLMVRQYYAPGDSQQKLLVGSVAESTPKVDFLLLEKRPLLISGEGLHRDVMLLGQNQGNRKRTTFRRALKDPGLIHAQ